MLTLGYSPCPNDTFIFYALAHKKLGSELKFSEKIRDVEKLNRMALNGELDITKASFHAYGFLRDDYCLLRSGSALGRGCGPLVVTKKKFPLEELSGKKIAIPGKLTTAYLLLKLFAPAVNDVVEMPFDSIMNAVSLGTVDAGLIIHEGRFTYPHYNLKMVIDLGEWWEQDTGLPIPLGCILAKKELGEETIAKIDRLLKESIQYGFRNRALAWEYIKKNAQEMDDKVIQQHIDLYVNDYTVDIGEGIIAVEKLLERAEILNLVPSPG